MAAFHLIIYGRFWVITKDVCTHGGRGDKILPHQHPADDEAYDNEHDAHFSELEAACVISLVSPIPLTLPENS
jgi:hypothetical protein